MAEHAILISRVSTARQQEEDQTPGLVEFAESQGYIVEAVTPIHGKSAFHGKHLAAVRKAIDTYVRHGKATVVIFRDVDRSSRQGAQATFDLRGEILRAGARMEFSGQPYLNDQRRQEMLLGLLATSAREESETKSRRTKQGMAAAQKRGELNGKPPWGYSIGKVDGKRTLVPNDLGNSWVPRIYLASAEGKSLSAMQRMLKGVPSPEKKGTWSDTTLRRIIANPTYCGLRQGGGNLKYTPLVSVELWQKANAAMASRARIGRGTVKREPALVRPICAKCYGHVRPGCPSGKSPMYRTVHGSHEHYACRGNGPEPHSCGARLIPLAALDKAVDEAMREDTQPYRVTEYVPGDDRAERLATVNEKMAAAARSGDYAEVAKLVTEASAIESEPMRKARVKGRETQESNGDHWKKLDLAGKREELLAWEITAARGDEFPIVTITHRSFL